MGVFKNSIKTAVLLGLLMGICIAVGSIWGERGVLLGFLFGGSGAVVSYFFSDRFALAAAHAVPVSQEEAPELYAIVESLAQRDNLPMPRIYISPEPAPNAFATGRNPAHGVVCVTQGLMQMMDRDELEGVIAHEMSHIKHRDILISTVAAVMAGAISSLAWMAMWGGMDGGGRRRGNDTLLFGLAAMILAPIAAGLVQMAVSRSREYAADAGAARLCGSPFGLISALKKLEVGNASIPMDVSPASSHMFIMHPLTRTGEGLAGMFRTHPPTEKRIAALVALAQHQPVA
jgi:heat shock protein HtpX